MKSLIQKISRFAGTLFVATGLAQKPYTIDTFTIAGGSDTVSGGAYSISANGKRYYRLAKP